jgi:hypothetical protein
MNLILSVGTRLHKNKGVSLPFVPFMQPTLRSQRVPNDPAHLPAGLSELHVTKGLRAPPVKCSAWLNEFAALKRFAGGGIFVVVVEDCVAG